MLIPRLFYNILFSLVLNILFEKIIFLKFWHSILEFFRQSYRTSMVSIGQALINSILICEVNDMWDFIF
jgi:hypothetical protein